MNTTDLVNGSIYSMALHAPQLYGSTLDDVTFLGRISASLVTAHNVVPAEEHAKAYSYLPDGTVDDPSGYSWLIFQTPTGVIRVIGEPWVQADSVVGEGATVVYKVTGILGDMDTPAKIRLALSSVGIYNFNISTV